MISFYCNCDAWYVIYIYTAYNPHISYDLIDFRYVFLLVFDFQTFLGAGVVIHGIDVVQPSQRRPSLKTQFCDPEAFKTKSKGF